MTGNGHRWTGVGAAFIAAAIAHSSHMPELVAAAVASVSCTLPDWSEIPVYRNGKRAGTLITHRTITHWPPLWLATIAWGIHLDGLIGSILIGAAVGSITHILGDAPNPMGIPWLIPTRRLRLGKKGWWRSGEREPIMALTYATIGFAAWRIVSM